MSSITVIVTCHDSDASAFLEEQINKQTKRPDKVILLCSGDSVGHHDNNVLTVWDADRKDWGHHKRHLGILLCETDYLTFWNVDDAYDSTFIERLLLPEADVIYCLYNHKSGHQLGTSFKQDDSSSGNYIMKTSLAKKVGWNHRCYTADGLFIRDINKEEPVTVFVNSCLYTHK